jgi:hypothetical protein
MQGQKWQHTAYASKGLVLFQGLVKLNNFMEHPSIVKRKYQL